MSAVADHSPPGVCPDCRGPSTFWKGDWHMWRCKSCVNVAIGLDKPLKRHRRPKNAPGGDAPQIRTDDDRAYDEEQVPA